MSNENLLKTHFLGFELENPWCVSSSPPSATGKLMAESFDAGWAAAVCKTVLPADEPIVNVTPRIHTLKKWHRDIAMQNIELITDRPLSVWLEELTLLKKMYPHKMVIGSVMAPGNDLDAWAQLVEAMNKAGCDAVELNLGCPHGMPERGMGSICSQDPELVYQITHAAKQVSKKPVLVKLTPNVTDIRPMAKAAKRAEADCITVINTVASIIGIDIVKKQPRMNVNGYTAIGGMSGMAVKPIGLKCVAECLQAADIPVSAVGGISTWEDGVEYLLMGATQLQVCTEIMLRGFKIIHGLNQGLEKYLAEQGASCVNDVIDSLYKKVTTFGHLLEIATTKKAVINTDACIACQLCQVSCHDAGYKAIYMTEIPDAENEGKMKRVAKVIDEECTGCNLCVAVCPEAGSITLRDTNDPFPYPLSDKYKGNTLL